MKLLDLFSGIGGFSHGLVQAGMELVGYCEIDKHAHQAFQILHDPEERLWNEYDVRTIDPVRLPDFDCICFGWPCQDNSIAGKRKGQVKRDESNEGNRSGLLFEATRIIRARKPKYFIAENVEGLFSVNDGRDFYATIREFTDMGYDIQWGVLNSSAYVPQNRKRIFFVGHPRGTRRPEVFPFGSENENTIEVIGKLEGNHDQNSRIYGIDGLCPTLSTMQGGGQEPKVLVTRQYDQLHIRDQVTCLDANYAKGLDNHQARTGVMEVSCINPRKVDGTQTYQHDRVYDTNGIMTCLGIDESGRYNIIHDYRIRKLTPLECFRLQSFPDWWYHKLKEHGISDSQLYKMAGNAVTSEVARQIGIRLMRSETA